MQKGYAVVAGEDRMELTLSLEMKPRLMEANPYVSDAAGKAAVMRGPVVYCLEAEEGEKRLHDCLLDLHAEFEEKECGVCGLTVLNTRGWQRPEPNGDWLYRPLNETLVEKELTLIPYFAFANRGERDMRVWIPFKR